MQQATQYEYTNSTGLTLGLIGSLAAYFLLWEVGIWSTFGEIDQLQRAIAAGVGFDDWVVANRQQAIISGLLLLSFFATAGLFLKWLHTMNRNAHALCAQGMRHGPLAAVAWFFAPVFHLWKPLEVLREVYQASDPDSIHEWHRSPVPQLMSLWWTLWLTFQLTVVLALMADMWAHTMIQLQTAAWLSVVVGMVAPPLGVAASICAWRLHARQRARYRATVPLRVRSAWPTRGGEDTGVVT